MVRQRKARSRIVHIRNEDGTLLEDPMEVENRLVNHFKASFEEIDQIDVGFILNELQNVDIPKLSHNQCLDLNMPITDLEIEDIVFQLGPHKAPPLMYSLLSFINCIGRLLKLMCSTLSKPSFI